MVGAGATPAVVAQDEWIEDDDSFCEINTATGETRTSPTWADSDGDAILDSDEEFLGLEPCNPDTDGDLMADGWESGQLHGHAFAPHDGSDGADDRDDDGLLNREEQCHPMTDARCEDRIHDSYLVMEERYEAEGEMPPSYGLYLDGTDPDDPDTDNDRLCDGGGADTSCPAHNLEGFPDGEHPNDARRGVGTHADDPDTDDDGLPDGWEAAYGTDPDGKDAGDDPDTDRYVRDGETLQNWTNIKEYCYPYHATADDPCSRSDEDRIRDDGVHTGGSDPREDDTDEDCAPDGFEVHLSRDPTVKNPREMDTDDDGLSDCDELVAGTDPLDPDTDGDGLCDGGLAVECRDGNGENTEDTDPLDRDTDDDTLDDGPEVYDHGSDPNDSDTDDDTLDDPTEVHTSRTDPADADTDDDTLDDGPEADWWMRLDGTPDTLGGLATYDPDDDGDPVLRDADSDDDGDTDDAEKACGSRPHDPDSTCRIVQNSAPDRPDPPQGPEQGDADEDHRYTASATDPDGDQLTYTFKWGDGQTSRVGPAPSSTVVSDDHAWSASDTYCVRVKVTDANDASSPWSACTYVTIEEPQDDEETATGSDPGDYGDRHSALPTTEVKNRDATSPTCQANDCTDFIPKTDAASECDGDREVGFGLLATTGEWVAGCLTVKTTPPPSGWCRSDKVEGDVALAGGTVHIALYEDGGDVTFYVDAEDARLHAVRLQRANQAFEHQHFTSDGTSGEHPDCVRLTLEGHGGDVLTRVTSALRGRSLSDAVDVRYQVPDGTPNDSSRFFLLSDADQGKFFGLELGDLLTTDHDSTSRSDNPGRLDATIGFDRNGASPSSTDVSVTVDRIRTRHGARVQTAAAIAVPGLSDPLAVHRLRETAEVDLTLRSWTETEFQLRGDIVFDRSVDLRLVLESYDVTLEKLRSVTGLDARTNAFGCDRDVFVCVDGTLDGGYKTLTFGGLPAEVRGIDDGDFAFEVGRCGRIQATVPDPGAEIVVDEPIGQLADLHASYVTSLELVPGSTSEMTIDARFSDAVTEAPSATNLDFRLAPATGSSSGPDYQPSCSDGGGGGDGQEVDLDFQARQLARLHKPARSDGGIQVSFLWHGQDGGAPGVADDDYEFASFEASGTVDGDDFRAEADNLRQVTIIKPGDDDVDIAIRNVEGKHTGTDTTGVRVEKGSGGMKVEHLPEDDRYKVSIAFPFQNDPDWERDAYTDETQTEGSWWTTDEATVNYELCFDDGRAYSTSYSADACDPFPD